MATCGSQRYGLLLEFKHEAGAPSSTRKSTPCEAAAPAPTPRTREWRSKLAVQLVEQLRYLRRTLGSGHPDTLCSLHNLGFVRCEQGQVASGLPLLREAVEGRRAAHGEGHPYTQLSIGAVAQFENASQQQQERDVAADASVGH